MKILFQLFVAVILIPASLHADSNNSYQVHQYQRIHYCTDFYFYEDEKYSERRSACFSLGFDANIEQIDIKAHIRCRQDEGTCEDDEDYRAYCQIDNAGPEVVQVLNKTQIIVDIQPEDCDVAINSVGSQFSATTNGIVQERLDYGNYFMRLLNYDTQCIIHSKGGSQERRSVDVEAVIEGKAVVSAASIYTITTDSLFNPCSLPW